MTEGVLSLSTPVLSAATVTALESRMLVGATVGYAARQASIALAKPKPTKLIPYVGWAIAIGSALYAGYEAYNSQVIAWDKMIDGVYDTEDMTVFRKGYSETVRAFTTTIIGRQIISSKKKFILIPREVMPIIASVDAYGMGIYGNTLTWDPANKTIRRRDALSGLKAAGNFVYVNGDTVRGSWEEYPFASTRGPRPGSHVDRVPLRENWIQGGFIRAASMVQFFKHGDSVLVFIL